MKEYPRFETGYRWPESLQPEQENLVQLITGDRTQREFIAIQGVAGSGKTTISLWCLKTIAEMYRTDLDNRNIMPILLTYNQQLASVCRRTLKNHTSVKSYLSPPGMLMPGKINVLTFHEFVFHLIDSDIRSRFRDDDDCIDKIVRNIIVRKKFEKMLPSHCFALITSFLKGREDIRGKNFVELERDLKNGKIQRVPRCYDPNTILWVKRFLDNEYKDKIADGLDRTDISWIVLKELRENEKLFDVARNLDLEDLRSKKMSLSDMAFNASDYGKLLAWLRRFFDTVDHYSWMNDPDQGIKIKEFLDETVFRNAVWPVIWKFVQDKLKAYGFLGTKIYKKVEGKIVNPLIIVDEIQDLSFLEINVLISLWFQLQKNNRRCRLVMIGDSNQQMMPTGFQWNEITEFLEKQCRRYDYPESRFSPSDVSFKEAMGKKISNPFQKLLNNYRTTEEIAQFVNQMVKNVVQKNFDEKVQKHWLENLVNASNTLPINIAEEIKDIDRHDLVTQIVVVDDDAFIEGLRKHLADLAGRDNKEESRLVVIAEDDTGITNMLEKNTSLMSMIVYYPILNCKGLEFMSCAVWGLPVKKGDRLSTDVLGQWYTVGTRAKLKEIIFLNKTQFENLEACGWSDIPKDVLYVVDASNWGKKEESDVVKEIISQIQGEVLDPESMKIAGEEYFMRFMKTLDEAFLNESLRYYRLGGFSKTAEDIRREVPVVYEETGKYKDAVRWYKTIKNYPSLVRCCKLYIDQLKNSLTLDASAEIEKYQKEAESFIHKLYKEGRFNEAMIGWELIGRFEKVADLAIQLNNVFKVENAIKKINDFDKQFKIRKWLIEIYFKRIEDTMELRWRSSRVADYLKKIKTHLMEIPDNDVNRELFFRKMADYYLRLEETHWGEAYKIYYEDLKDEYAAETLIRRWKEKKHYIAIADSYSKTNQARLLADLSTELERTHFYAYTSYCFAKQKEYIKAAQYWMKEFDDWRNRADKMFEIKDNQPLKKTNIRDARDFLKNMKRFARTWKGFDGRLEKVLKIDTNIVSVDMSLESFYKLRKKVFESFVSRLKEHAEDLVLRLREATEDIQIENREIKIVKALIEECRSRKRAENSIEQLWEKKNDKDRLTAIKCWKSIGDEDQAMDHLDRLPVVKHVGLIRRALDVLYHDNVMLLKKAREKFREKLELKNPENKEELIEQLLSGPENDGSSDRFAEEEAAEISDDSQSGPGKGQDDRSSQCSEDESFERNADEPSANVDAAVPGEREIGSINEEKHR